MKSLVLVLLALVPITSYAESTDYETIVELEAKSVSSLLSGIEARLGTSIRSDEIAVQAESLDPGMVVQRAFDMSYGGATFEVLYQVAALESGHVSVSFSAYQRRAIEAICLEFFRASGGSDEEQALESCDLRVPQTFRV